MEPVDHPDPTIEPSSLGVAQDKKGEWVGLGGGKQAGIWQTQNVYSFSPVGFLESCFIEKNGTPRQGLLVPNSIARLRVSPFDAGGSSESLEGLEGFSHVWLTFIFHANSGHADRVRPKIKPPRAGGKKLGVFATRSPHRPCPIGLSLAKVPPRTYAFDFIFYTAQNKNNSSDTPSKTL